ncbi:uncharacterized protein G2W53_030929 [Senna tora]|uniref:Uncharacterized protein n=1 Tax=Senna tora TaxID=362788 RepID=A0A834T8C8_9FABA|nr:uncharacterized protein G2W53_030929 [Senna tora]
MEKQKKVEVQRIERRVEERKRMEASRDKA